MSQMRNPPQSRGERAIYMLLHARPNWDLGVRYFKDGKSTAPLPCTLAGAPHLAEEVMCTPRLRDFIVARKGR